MTGVLLLIGGVTSEEQQLATVADDAAGILPMESTAAVPLVMKREKRFLLAAALIGGLVGYKRGYYGTVI